MLTTRLALTAWVLGATGTLSGCVVTTPGKAAPSRARPTAPSHNCPPGSTWVSLYKRCKVTACFLPKRLDRGTCVNRCPLGTVAWSARGDISLKCSTAMELRDYIFHYTTHGAESMAQQIARAKAALAKLPATMTGCDPPDEEEGKTPTCRRGAAWYKYYERCTFQTCPAGQAISRGECFDTCSSREIAWRHPYKSRICSTEVELQDQIGLHRYLITKTSPKPDAMKIHRNVIKAAEAALASLQMNAASIARNVQQPPHYGRCASSPEAPPELVRENGGHTPDDQRGPPPPDDLRGPPPPDD